MASEDLIHLFFGINVDRSAHVASFVLVGEAAVDQDEAGEREIVLVRHKPCNLGIMNEKIDINLTVSKVRVDKIRSIRMFDQGVLLFKLFFLIQMYKYSNLITKTTKKRDNLHADLG